MNGDGTNQPVTMLADRIEKCVECGYSFAGLPLEAGACPECGLRYDEWSRTFKVKTKRHQVLLIIFIGTVLAISSISSLLGYFVFTDRSGLALVILISGIVNGAGAIYILKNLFRKRKSFAPLVVCLADGFYFASAPAEAVRFYAWSEFSGELKEMYSLSWGVSLRYREDKKPWGRVDDLVVHGAFQGRAERDEFMAIAEAHLDKA